MDYGKLAYLRVEDLERVIGQSAKRQKDFRGGRAVFEVEDFLNGSISLCDLNSETGGVCLIIKVACAAASDCFLDVLVDGKPAARHAVSRTDTTKNIKNSAKEQLILLQVNAGKNQILSLSGSGIYIKNVTVMAIGGEISSANSRIFGDTGNGYAVVLAGSNNNITLFEGAEESIDFLNGKNETVAKSADVCFSDGQFFIVIKDLYDNIWLKNHSAKSDYRFVCAGGEGDVAITSAQNGLCIAFIKDGKVHTVDLHSFYDSALAEDAEIDTTFSALAFAKGGERPLLTLKNKSTTCFILAEKHAKTAENVSIRVMLG